METILWDFDGVILDSMPIRDWGFRQIFKNYNKKKIDQLINYHNINGGLSRYVKIRYFYNIILDKHISEKQVLKYAKEFSILMKQRLTDFENIIPETFSFLKNNYKRYNFHIVSGSDEKELKFLCKKLNLEKYFLSINGSPKAKNVIVTDLITYFSLNRSNTCLIGDSINDYEAAKKNHIKFYGFNNSELIKLDNYISSFKQFDF